MVWYNRTIILFARVVGVVWCVTALLLVVSCVATSGFGKEEPLTMYRW